MNYMLRNIDFVFNAKRNGIARLTKRVSNQDTVFSLNNPTEALTDTLNLKKKKRSQISYMIRCLLCQYTVFIMDYLDTRA